MKSRSLLDDFVAVLRSLTPGAAPSDEVLYGYDRPVPLGSVWKLDGMVVMALRVNEKLNGGMYECLILDDEQKGFRSWRTEEIQSFPLGSASAFWYMLS